MTFRTKMKRLWDTYTGKRHHRLVRLQRERARKLLNSCEQLLIDQLCVAEGRERATINNDLFLLRAKRTIWGI